jgi:hypothetical protein
VLDTRNGLADSPRRATDDPHAQNQLGFRVSCYLLAKIVELARKTDYNGS